MPTNPSTHPPQVVVAGSLAFDHIMDFPGSFRDHILTEKIHVINISFLVEDVRKQRGGCAGNIAYALALLGERPRVVATAGNDFFTYGQWLEEHGVDIGGIEVHDDITTATCFITTDRAGSQITGFYVGAMQRARDLDLATRCGPHPALCVVAPDDPLAMVRHCQAARRLGIPLFFDPSFQVTAMDGDALVAAAQGATVLLVNDYEYAVFQEKTGRRNDDLFELVETVVVTLGKEGSRILRRDEDEILVPAAQLSSVVDPTGAGDAFRGGFVAGWMRGYDLAECGRLGSVAAVFAIESYGTQTYSFTPADFEQRYAASFGHPSRLATGARASAR